MLTEAMQAAEGICSTTKHMSRSLSANMRQTEAYGGPASSDFWRPRTGWRGQGGGRAAAAPRAGDQLESLLKAPQPPPERCPSSSGLACWVSLLFKGCWPGGLERELSRGPAPIESAGTEVTFCPEVICGVSWSCTIHLWLIIRIYFHHGGK